MSVGYIEPGSVSDIGSYTRYPGVSVSFFHCSRCFRRLHKAQLWLSTFGYWKWFAGEDAAEVMEQNVS